MKLYQDTLSLLTDLYQLTMAYGYWKTGMADREAVFHLYFRRHPFKGNYTIAAGLDQAIAYMNGMRFTEEDVQYLSTLRGNDEQPLFEQDFLDYLSSYRLTCDVDAIPEGTVVFPDQPLIRVKGKLIDCQLLETPLLNIVNFQSLIATKSSRVCAAAKGEPVIEFGLRRAQGPDGGVSASRAAYIGGCSGTSNVLAGKLFGVPVKGTHAHAWVMAFPDELEAFYKYADALPNNCIFLVDTYDTIRGVKNAIEAGRRLRAAGHKLGGIRLDSGDMAALSIEARKLLDEAGFPEAGIVASNDLDEYRIAELKAAGAKINIWGIGTHMVTAYDQPALGGVYKLGAIRDEAGNWQYRVKISGDVEKMTTPGILALRRYFKDGWDHDMIYDEELGVETEVSGAAHEELLRAVMRAGQQVYASPPLSEIRLRCMQQVSQYLQSLAVKGEGAKYKVALEERLLRRKQEMIKAKSSDVAAKQL